MNIDDRFYLFVLTMATTAWTILLSRSLWAGLAWALGMILVMALVALAHRGQGEGR